MIGNPLQLSNETKEFLVEHLHEKFDLLPDAALKSQLIIPIVDAIDFYIKENGRNFYSSVHDSEHILMLAVKALDAVGCTMEARELFLVNSRTIAPVKLDSYADKKPIVLDLMKLIVGDGSDIEILLFLLIKSILDCLGAMWDVSGGDGVIVLKNLRTSARLLHRKNKEKQIKIFMDEIILFVLRALNEIASQHHWQKQPMVLTAEIT